MKARDWANLTSHMQVLEWINAESHKDTLVISKQHVHVLLAPTTLTTEILTPEGSGLSIQIIIEAAVTSALIIIL